MSASRSHSHSGYSPLPLGFLALLLLGLSAGLGLLYSTVSIQELTALRNAIYARNEMPEFVLQVSAGRYQVLRLSLLGTALGTVAGLVYLHRQGRLGPELWALWQELKAAFSSVGQALWHLSKPEKALAALLLLGIEGLRVYYFLVYPLWTDEVATYDYFVSGGPVAITSFYPIPNNHILFSLCSWAFSWFTDNDQAILRLPTFLISLAGTVLAYAVLIRLTTFRVATLTVGLFCLSPMGMYYAMAGRGYFLLVALVVGQFFATVAILYFQNYQRLGWGLFLLTGILGMYTIPVYAYPLASLGFWLGTVLLWRKQMQMLLHLLLAGALIAAATVLLYSPVICVSGLSALMSNEYVAPQTLAEFWQSYFMYLRQPARELFGHEQLSVGAFLILLLVALGALPFLPRTWQRLASPALVLVLLPFLFMPLQRVYAPARVLLYATFFFFMAVSFAGEWLVRRVKLSALLSIILVGVVTGLYGAYQTRIFHYGIRTAQHREALLRQSYRWLHKQQAQRVFFQAPFHKLYFHHYASLEHYPLYLFEAPSAPGAQYEYVVVEGSSPSLPPLLTLAAYSSAYTDEWVTIYRAPSSPNAKLLRAPQMVPRVRK